MKTTVICMLLSPFLLTAQQNNGAWTNIGPSPAAVEAILVDPQGSGTIFVGSDAGGVRKSVDGGITWSAVNSGLTPLNVLALAMDASGPQTVYAGTVGGGLFKTDDGGATWQNLFPGLVGSVAADPNRSGVVYAGVFNNLAIESIRKSIDGGVTWATIFPTTAAIFNITIDPENFGRSLCSDRRTRRLQEHRWWPTLVPDDGPHGTAPGQYRFTPGTNFVLLAASATAGKQQAPVTI